MVTREMISPCVRQLTRVSLKRLQTRSLSFPLVSGFSSLLRSGARVSLCVVMFLSPSFFSLSLADDRN